MHPEFEEGSSLLAHLLRRLKTFPDYNFDKHVRFTR